MSVKVDRYYTDDGTLKYYIFYIDQSGGLGALAFTHETNLYYNVETGEWTGDELNVSGWVDLDEEDVKVLVKHYDLEDYIHEEVQATLRGVTRQEKEGEEDGI